MIFKTQNPGDQSLQWTYKQWIPRAAAILLGVIFLLVGLSHLQQPSLQGGGVRLHKHPSMYALQSEAKCLAHAAVF